MKAIIKITVDCPVCGYPATKTENAVDNSSVCECLWCGSKVIEDFESGPQTIYGHGSAHIGNDVVLFQSPLLPKDLSVFCKNAEESGGQVYTFEGELIAEYGELPLTVDEIVDNMTQSFHDDSMYETDYITKDPKEGINYDRI